MSYRVLLPIHRQRHFRSTACSTTGRMKRWTANISTSGTLPPRSCNPHDQLQFLIRPDMPSRFICVKHGMQNANVSGSATHVNSLPSLVPYLSTWPSDLNCCKILVISTFPDSSLSSQSLLIGTAILHSQPMMGQCCLTRKAYLVWDMSR